MVELDASPARQVGHGRGAVLWIEPLLGLGVGVLGGALQKFLLGASTMHVFYGALFGITFGLFFSRRATSPGAGLIWGVAAALLLWIVVPSGFLPMRHAGHGI